jgi:signal transduction histidine kinase
LDYLASAAFANAALNLLIWEIPEEHFAPSSGPGRMNQVLTNLVMNAIHACEDAQQKIPNVVGACGFV